ASFYAGGATSPISDIYGALPGSPTSAAPASEFVYLNRDLNSLKGVLFGQKNPSVKDKSKSILKLAQLGSLSEYLHDDHVVAIYRAVSNRVKARFVNFGAACAAVDSGDGRFKAFKDLEGVDWASAYESWEGEYLRKVEENTRAFVVAAAALARGRACKDAGDVGGEGGEVGGPGREVRDNLRA
ncbi:hypothetical protein V491_04501, partial [Pseudogymnoascus sp. VKM F-3775]